MNKYFYPNGEEIKKQEEFIRFYSQVYYYRNRDRKLEDDIEDILNNDTLTRKDVVKIFRWKVDTTKYDYGEETVQSRYGKIKVGALLECLGVKHEDKEFKKGQLLLNNSPKETFDQLICQDGIGLVYAITLLYFLTNGECPIYDQFAHIAVNAICKCKEDTKFDCLVNDKELQKGVPVGSWKSYQENYVKRIETIFPDYKTNRNVDRALWAYGHLFNKTESTSQEER